MPSSPGSVGLARAHPLTKSQAMEPSRKTWSSYGPPYPLGRWSWAVLVLGCIWLFVLHTRFNRAFRPVFRFVSDNFGIVCTHTAFFIEKKKALGDFQIVQIIFASFVPDLSAYSTYCCSINTSIHTILLLLTW